ncbi:MAG: nucleoside/nucleotide kinase family protein [Thiofilum sp.]|uniref:nucleoside/nucleotide kinase family protein n=1 Tax=Thiofilum sp. TaxID=2212733 RepID=UPI0025F54EA0|nr:nucleoside/nucleotide kinase family protein [Thiofilum sp.]MBK8455412.1 nucleoside/nucleotide kinase family protein [Thiofilum sp.]
MTTPTVNSIAELLDCIHQLDTQRRQIIAIAAPPAAGKSTLAQRLVEAINQKQTDSAKVIPMDGFHLDNRVLSERGLLARKGAPETFDTKGFIHLIKRLKVEYEVVIPLFDRERDIAIAGADIVREQHKLLVVEGNYLLLNSAPWSELHELWDLSIWIEVEEAVLEQRLIERWLSYGFNSEEAKAKALLNDLPNARKIINESIKAKYTLVIR